MEEETSEVCRYTNIIIYYTKKSQPEPHPVDEFVAYCVLVYLYAFIAYCVLETPTTKGVGDAAPLCFVTAR